MQCRLSLDAAELGEKLRSVLLRDADSLIDHDDPSGSAIAINDDRDRRPLGGVLDCVAQEVPHDDLKSLGINVGGDWSRWRVDIQLSAGKHGPHAIDRELCELDDVALHLF